MWGFQFEGKDVTASFLLVSNAMFLIAVNALAPENYMDEPFHVPQTQHFCSGNFGVWDPKITTFPGLYIVSAAIMRMYAWLGAHIRLDPSATYAPCSTVSLRAINTALWVLCFYVLLAILEQQQQQQQPPCSSNDGVQQHEAEKSKPDQVQGRQRHSPSSAYGSSSASLASHLRSPSSPCLWAATLSLFPLHWFYSILFYTDVGAHLFLLACLLLSMQQRYGLAAAAGGLAVLFRQTNAVWVAFVLGAAALHIAQDCQAQQHARASQKHIGVNEGGLLNTLSAEQMVQRPPQLSNKQDQRQKQQQQQVQDQQEQRQQEQQHQPDAAGVASVLSTLGAVWCSRGKILRLLWPLALVPAAFAAFLMVNKGVTVGDRSAHHPVRHFAQLVYFGLFCAVLLLVPLIATSWLTKLPYIKPSLQPLPTPQKRPTPSQQQDYTFPWSQPGQLAWFALTFTVTGLCLTALHSAPSPHPYLLADNRHFTFYIWRWLLAPRGWLHALVLAAAAAATWMTMIRALAAGRQRRSNSCSRGRCEQQRSNSSGMGYSNSAATREQEEQQQQFGVLWVCGYVAAVTLVLVPAWLLEFRYFTTPLLLLAIHMPRPTCLQAYAVLCCYTAINAITLYLFLWKPFTWADGTVARFMW